MSIHYVLPYHKIYLNLEGQLFTLVFKNGYIAISCSLNKLLEMFNIQFIGDEISL